MQLSAERAQEIKSSTFTDLDFHLENWARWMQAHDGPEGLPSKASGGLKAFTTMENDSTYARLDTWLAEHTDAAVKALTPAERAALYHAYDLTSVWRFPRDNFDDLLASARSQVRATLLRRGVVVT